MNSKLLLTFYCISIYSILHSASFEKVMKNEGFVFIPSGTFLWEEKFTSINGLYMAKGEITNRQFRTFLQDIKTKVSDEEYKSALPDTARWNLEGFYLEPMMNYYFSHPAYADYPVVNITDSGAKMYCAWILEKLKNSFPEHDNVNVRLPTRAEWCYAAMRGLDGAIYSWAGNSLFNEKGKCRANCKYIGDENITQIDSAYKVVQNSAANYSLDNSDLIAPSFSYEPNVYGLFNMCGNVAELTITKSEASQQDNVTMDAVGGHWNSTGYDIRILSKYFFAGASPFVGFRPVVTMFSKEN